MSTKRAGVCFQHYSSTQERWWSETSDKAEQTHTHRTFQDGVHPKDLLRKGDDKGQCKGYGPNT